MVMEKLRLLYDYKNNEILRLSFNELAQQTFGISFEEWYQAGFWNDRYICYSYVDEHKVVANLSVSKMDLVLHGKKIKALQIGTVMTHSDYRKRGLLRKLMEFVLDQYEEEYDLIYLFGNKSVLEFYPKFGFTPHSEIQFSLDVKVHSPEKKSVQKLDASNADHVKLVQRLAVSRRPISQVCGFEQAEHLLMWYFLNVFKNYYYYLPENDALVVAAQGENTLHLFDIVSREEVDFSYIVNQIADQDVTNVAFYFNPDVLQIQVKSSLLEEDDDVLFVKSKVDLGEKFKYPITAQA